VPNPWSRPALPGVFVTEADTSTAPNPWSRPGGVAWNAPSALTDWDHVGYKVVARVGARFFSVWAGESAEYRLGVASSDEARPRHGGGLYICRSADAALAHRIPVRSGGLFMAPRSLLRCACEGPFVEYPGGKIACSRLTPLELLPMPEGYSATRPSTPGRQRPRAMPSRPMTPAMLSGRSPLRSETEALEAEVAEMERRLGYR